MHPRWSTTTDPHWPQNDGIDVCLAERIRNAEEDLQRLKVAEEGVLSHPKKELSTTSGGSPSRTGAYAMNGDEMSRRREKATHYRLDGPWGAHGVAPPPAMPSRPVPALETEPR